MTNIRRRGPSVSLAVSLAALACAACGAAGDFPSLAAVEAPPPASTDQAQRAARLTAIDAAGDVAREAGRMVRAGEELSRPLPPQPR